MRRGALKFLSESRKEGGRYRLVCLMRYMFFCKRLGRLFRKVRVMGMMNFLFLFGSACFGLIVVVKIINRVM